MSEQFQMTDFVDLPTAYGKCSCACIRDIESGSEHFIAIFGNDLNNIRLRIHSECLTGDVFRSERCDCGDQLDAAMKVIQTSGSGIVIYLRQEGRGIGLFDKLKAYQLQEKGFDTVDANIELGLPVDARTYTAAVFALKKLGIDCVRLLTNNPSKVLALVESGICVTEQIAIKPPPRPFNLEYLKVKQDRLNHK